MVRFRTIPVLLLQDLGLVKTRQFKDPTYVGDPINAVKIFNLKEVDELLFLDINASKLNKEPDYDLLADIASEAFMPFAYGGGITSIKQIRSLLRLGVEKVILNSALSNREFVKEAVETFGSSTIVASIDVINIKNLNYVYSHVKKLPVSDNVTSFIKEVEEMGVGEIMVNSVNRDGMYMGFDLNSLRVISESVNVPVIGCGGARGMADIEALKSGTQCTAAAAGSMFVFYGRHKAVLITYPSSEELENLNL